MPDHVSSCTFSLQLAPVAPSVIEKSELSSFGLQCTFASAAVGGKIERIIKSRGWQRDRAHLKLNGHPVIFPPLGKTDTPSTPMDSG